MTFKSHSRRSGTVFRKCAALGVILCLIVIKAVPALAEPPSECVILLHGLARTSKSMDDMEFALTRLGYRVFNIDYPSREFDIQTLSRDVVSHAVLRAQAAAPAKIHFVTHSMGGILVRFYLSQYPVENLGRVVMLSPPNQGSEVVDKIGDWPAFYWLNGPAGAQLGTEAEDLPGNLGNVDFELGVITGDRTINFFLSMMIPGDDDGKVSIESARVAGMSDFLVVHHTHPFIMKSEDVIHQTQYFLQHGRFERKDPSSS